MKKFLIGLALVAISSSAFAQYQGRVQLLQEAARNKQVQVQLTPKVDSRIGFDSNFKLAVTNGLVFKSVAVADLKATGTNTTVFTVPAGRIFVVLGGFLNPTAAVSMTAGPAFDFRDTTTSVVLTAVGAASSNMTAINKPQFVTAPAGTTVSGIAVGGDVIAINIGTGASANSAAGTAYVYGIYIQ